MNIAVLSNSYGEDRSAALICKYLRNKNPDVTIKALPLISMGEEYKKRGIEVYSGSKPPPSGGFFLRSFHGMLSDIIETSSLPFRYLKLLKDISDNSYAVLVVGDIPLLILGWLGFRKNIYFLAPCKSDWMTPHFWIEEIVMRKITEVVFTHDELTASNLRRKGINALFLGNPMMDDLEPENNYRPPEGKKLIGILPGSRKESYNNFRMINRVIMELCSRRADLHFAVAVSDTVDTERMKEYAGKYLNRIDFAEKSFVDILENSKLVIGLAGTAVEQAIGLGNPVISFPGSGPQTTKKRIEGQKELLGKAFISIQYKPEVIADRVVELLENKDLMNELKREGMNRMGPSGGAERIADYILEN